MHISRYSKLLKKTSPSNTLARGIYISQNDRESDDEVASDRGRGTRYRPTFQTSTSRAEAVLPTVIGLSRRCGRHYSWINDDRESFDSVTDIAWHRWVGEGAVGRGEVKIPRSRQY